MKAYKLFNTRTGKYYESTYKGTPGIYLTMAKAARAVAHTGYAKKTIEIHGFELTQVSTRTNQDGGKWNAEVSINSNN